MAFTYTSDVIYPYAKMAAGTYTSDSGSTGGDIDTGLPSVKAFFLQPKGASVVANQSVYNEDLPLGKSTVTIVTNANETGSWMAISD